MENMVKEHQTKTDARQSKKNSSGAIVKNNGTPKSNSHLAKNTKLPVSSGMPEFNIPVVSSFGDRDVTFNEPLSFSQRLIAQSFLSIDIDTDKIRYVAGKSTSRKMFINERGVLHLPETDNNKLKATKILLDNIHANIYKSGQSIHACLYSPDVTIRPLLLPKMRKGSELNNAVYYKLQTELSGFNDKSIWRFKISEEIVIDEAKYFKIIVLVVPGDVIQSYLDLFDASGLQLETITVRPVALNNAFNKLVFDGGNDVLVDISYALTHINFISNGTLEYTRTIASGASNFEVAIRGKKGKILENDSFVLEEEDGISKEGALRPELLRKALGLRLNALKTQQNPVLRLFKNELQHSLEYFNSIDKKKPVKRIFLSGYGIQKESLVSFLKNNLKLPVFVLSPKIEDGSVLEHGEYLTSIGTNIESDDPFNLVPKSYRTNVLFKRLNYAAVLVAFIAMLGLYNYNHVLDLTISSLNSQVQYQTQQYNVLNPVEAEYIKDMQLVKTNNTTIAELKKKLLPGSPIVDLMKLFSNETPDQIVITSINLNRISPVLQKSRTASNTNGNQTPGMDSYIIRVSGEVSGDYLMSDVILINYMDRLRGLGYFKSIDISDKMKKNNMHKMLFEFKAIL